MLRFLSLSSGSCGNCYYLESSGDSGRHAVVIDTGVSPRKFKQVFTTYGLVMEGFSAILITHDHMDHIRGLAAYCKRLKKPVYASAVLHSALAARSFGAPYLGQCRHDLAEGEWNDVGVFRVKYFVVPHDATQTVGYCIGVEGRRFVIMTDVGAVTEEALEYASGADTVVIESNYDVEMLKNGPYPLELQRRIRGGNGHLSNVQCAEAIKSFWHPGLKNLFLCHLSDHNNTPELAYESARKALEELGVEEGTVNLRALPRKTPSGIINL